MIQIKDLILH